MLNLLAKLRAHVDTKQKQQLSIKIISLAVREGYSVEDTYRVVWSDEFVRESISKWLVEWEKFKVESQKRDLDGWQHYV